MACGKAEAQFFPFIPKDVTAVTRMGFKKGVSRKMILDAMDEFGKNDMLYDLMNEFEVKEGECWMVRPGFVHAPGPVLTIEIQRPQDDFNFLGKLEVLESRSANNHAWKMLVAWKLGEKINFENLQSMREDNQLRGLRLPSSSLLLST
jgi:mannose-6-phosphate isomerase class I